MARLSGPKRLTIALSGGYLITLVVVYLTVFNVTMNRLMDERGPPVVMYHDAFIAVYQQSESEARWAAIGAVAAVFGVTLIAGAIVLTIRWVARGYQSTAS